jgi:hypothetical protein
MVLHLNLKKNKSHLGAKLLTYTWGIIVSIKIGSVS